MQILSILFILF